MPYKEKEIEKRYYTISEVAEMFRISVSNVRFWEKEFDILKPRKTKKGDRLFTKEDIRNLKIIHNLVKEQGYTLDGARKKLRKRKDEAVAAAEVVERLENIKMFLKEMRDNL